MQNKRWLWIECLFLFGVTPFFFYYIVMTPAADFPIDLGGFEPRRMIFPVLWLIAIWVMVAHKRKHPTQKIFLKIHWHEVRSGVLPRFALSVAFMIGLVLLLDEARFFQFPRERTDMWAIVMVAYPLVSVVPQEVLYRLFFFERYAPIFKSGWPMMIASGLAFGHAHIVFNNPIAYLMCIAGGVLFSITYVRTRNLSLVWLEHAIYGQFVFTVGLGWYFYTGAAASHG
jgi:hypothetical protein